MSIVNANYFDQLKERYELLDDATASFGSLVEDKPQCKDEFLDYYPEVGVSYEEALDELNVIEEIFNNH